MAAIAFGAAATSLTVTFLLNKLSSPVIKNAKYYFQAKDKLKSLERTLDKIYSLVGHAEMQIVHDPDLAKWLRELKSVARDAEDVLDDFAAEAVSKHNIGQRIDKIQKRLAEIADEKRNLALPNPTLQVQAQPREFRTTTSLLTKRKVFGRDDEKKNLILMLGVDPSVHSIPDGGPLGNNASSAAVPRGTMHPCTAPLLVSHLETTHPCTAPLLACGCGEMHPCTAPLLVCRWGDHESVHITHGDVRSRGNASMSSAPAGAPVGDDGAVPAGAPVGDDSAPSPGAPVGAPAGAPVGDDDAFPADAQIASAGAFSVLPVVGMAGLGKTTLVRDVYNDPKVKRHFYPRIWVYVSHDFNVRRITEEIIAAVSHQRPCCCGIASLDKLQSDLRCKLSNQKFLLVLDDVWNENCREWDKLFAPLKLVAEGSKVLITTRSTKVADIIGTMDPIFLKPLPYKNCWDLFKACAFVKNNCDDHPGLQEIGQMIVKWLNGVPLAVQTIGDHLSSNTDEEVWKTILNSQLWKLSDDIMPALRLSYQDLPWHLKQCFEFCSIFPRDHKFSKDSLIDLWMAQGFIQPQEKRRIEDVGGEYFDELVHRSLFLKVDDGNFLMHDLMHDLAQSVSSDECVIIDDNTPKIPEMLLHLSLHHFDNSFKFENLHQHKRLRSLVLLEKNSRYNITSVPKELFDNLKYMRVLDLRHSDIVELPDSIASLKHLRYLDVSYTKIRSLPDKVGDLRSLQTMLLMNCQLDALPDCMNKLINLRNFKGRAGLLTKVVGIGKLKSLQQLDQFEVSRKKGRKVGELSGLNELRGRLNISKLENVISEGEAGEASLITKKYLHALELEWGTGTRDIGADQKQVLDSLKPHPNLKALKISCNDGSGFPSWLANEYLPNLEDVSLVKCQRWSILPPLGQLTSVKYIEIGGLTGVEKLLPEFWAGSIEFPVLVKLTICDMAKLRELGVDNIPSLQKLDINGCPLLKVMPALPPTLKDLNLSEVGLRALPRLWGCVGASSSSSSSLTSSSLSFVSISSCSELTSLDEGLLQFCHSALKTFEISNCEKLVSLSNQEGFSQLTSLTILVINNCPLVKVLPALPPTLEDLKISEVGLIALPRLGGCDGASSSRLSSVYLSSCPELTSLQEGLLEYHHSALKTLNISNCKKLVNIPTGGFSQFISLTSLVIDNCPNLTSLPEDHGLPASLESLIVLSYTHFFTSNQSLANQFSNLTSLSTLSIATTPKLISLSEEVLRCLTALEKLAISCCEELVTLDIKALTALNTLVVTNCHKLVSLAGSNAWQENNPLISITVRDCASLHSLPPNLEQLSHLEELTIRSCPLIISRPTVRQNVRVDTDIPLT